MTLILYLVQEKWKEQKRPKKFQNEKKKTFRFYSLFDKTLSK